jgi:sRNA-binding protein
MKINREDSEAVVHMLVDKYPKCFFEDPRLRRLLTHDIMRDLQEDGFPVASELMVAGVDWYTGHFGYQYALQAGAKRLDLDGKEVGTVTEQECLNARKRVRDDRQKLNERNNAVITLAALHAAGRIPGDQLRKLDAPPAMAKPKVSPELMRLHEAFVAANTTLSGTSDAGLRLAMTSAALQVVIKEAQRIINTTTERDQ